MNIDIDSYLLIRKTGHFFAFFLLAYFLYTVIKNILNKKLSTYVLVLFICLFVGVMDEFRQSFIQGRTSSVIDVVIDFSGAVYFFLIKEITDLFDIFVKFIMGIIFRSKNSKHSQVKHTSLESSKNMPFSIVGDEKVEEK